MVRRGVSWSRPFSDAVFLGAVEGEALAAVSRRCLRLSEPDRHIRAGAAGGARERPAGRPFPVAGPRDVIGDVPVGRLSEDLRAACLDALQISRIACVEFAAKHSWEASARAFIENM